MESAPLISVIVPCYNQAAYLSECLDSVIAQNFTQWECIVVNDGSTDQTNEVASEYCKKDSRIVYHFQNNKGLSGARNAGLVLAKGEFVNFLDSDDCISPEALMVLIETIRDRPDLSMVFSGYVGSKETLNNPVKEVLPFYDFTKNSFFEVLCKGNILPVHAALVRRKIIDQIGMFDESLKSCEDWDFWLRLGRVTNGVLTVKEPLVTYRITLGSMTRNVFTFFDAGIKVLNRITSLDDRVKNPLEEFKYGLKDHNQSALLIWYTKGIGLFLAQKNVKAACDLLLELNNTHKLQLDSSNFFEIWRQVLFGAILMKERQKAWKNYKLVMNEFLDYSSKLYNNDKLLQAVLKAISYYNAPLAVRLFFRFIDRVKLLVKSND